MKRTDPRTLDLRAFFTAAAVAKLSGTPARKWKEGGFFLCRVTPSTKQPRPQTVTQLRAQMDGLKARREQDRAARSRSQMRAMEARLDAVNEAQATAEVLEACDAVWARLGLRSTRR